MAKSKKIRVDISKLGIQEIFPKIQIINNKHDLINSSNYKAYFGIELNPLYSFEGNAIKIELKINIDIEHENELLKKVGEFSYDFIYTYENLISLINSDGNLDEEIFLTCSNISYSTLRGIIYSKSANTCLENVLIPIVTGSELMAGLEPSN